MENWHEKYGDIDRMLDMSDMLDEIESESDIESPIQEGALGSQATHSGIQTQDLQSLIDGWAEALNRSAIAKSTGLPVKTSVEQYKGFAAEEYFKQTLNINARAKGISSYNFDAFTNGKLPDGGTLSCIDMHSDIVAYGRKWPWQKMERVADAQSKIHSGKNAARAYAKDMAKKQYAEQEFVGGEGQGVNSRVHAKIGKTEIASDSGTPEQFKQLAEDMKKQSVPEYEHSAEKYQQLNRIHLWRAVKTGAITGAVISTASEICNLIKERDSLSEEQFIESIQHILCGTVDGGIRGGAIMGSVQIVGSILGKQIPANTLGAVPVMAAANIAVDFAKDLYRCFIARTIDADDLLCNSISYSFSSAAGFGGSWAGGQIAVQVMAHAISAKAAAATGATIGSALGPIGTIVGSAVGGLLFGLGASAISKIGEKDAKDNFDETMRKINSHVEAEGVEKLYYFANSMAEISEFKLSFKDLLPCYNIISDLKEYNLHKKAIKHIHEQLESGFAELESDKNKELRRMDAEHQHRLGELKDWLQEQTEIMQSEYRSSVENYVAQSYMQYVELYDIISQDIKTLVSTLESNSQNHSIILTYVRNRNAINRELNDFLMKMMEEDDDIQIIQPIVQKMFDYMQQDQLLVGKQYISFEEALLMVKGVA